MKDERWVAIILICLIIVLTIIDITAFGVAKFEVYKQRSLIAENQQLKATLQQQNQAVNSFVSQLQTCEKMSDVDKVLKTVNVERIK